MSKAADPNQEDPLKKKYFKRTSLTFGGNGLNIIKVNNQFSVMTGGRGSATFRYMWGTNLPYISTRNLNGFSCYIGFLVSACSCD